MDRLKEIEKLVKEYQKMSPELTLKEVIKQLKADITLYERFGLVDTKKK
jgi:hypothetical protein